MPQTGPQGPMTLSEVLAARQGATFDEATPVMERPLISPTDERGNPLPTGTKVELRNDGDDDNPTEVRLDGYASRYDVAYPMYGGKDSAWGWDETVVAGAGSKSLSESPDVVLLINHRGLPLARTANGTLRLSEERHGLRNEADLLRADTDVARLLPKMERGDVDEESFAFRVTRQEWNEDYTERWITEYAIHRGDVSIVTFGANPHTSATLRSVDGFLQAALTDPEGLVAELRTATHADPLELVSRAHEALGRLLNTGSSQTSAPSPTFGSYSPDSETTPAPTPAPTRAPRIVTWTQHPETEHEETTHVAQDAAGPAR